LKVKKFRIKPRLPVVGRWLKSFLSAKKIPVELEESLPLEIQSVTSQLVPSALYQTWTQGEIPAVLDNVLEANGWDKAISVSVVVATVGSQLEEKIAELLMKGETNRSQVLAAIGEESADLAFHFIFRLLTDDAKSDDCEVSEPLPLTDKDVLQESLQLLEASQEGVGLDSAGHLSPRFTRVSLVAWWPASKKKRLANLSKNPSFRRKPESRL
jgi:hypothetical protein